MAQIAEHYNIELDRKQLKNNMKANLKAKLVEEGILTVREPQFVTPVVSPGVTGLSFEQRVNAARKIAD